MNLALKPIETAYRGYRFRSRLEARWAVFFDAAGIDWQYEPEGYRVEGRPYLPDFWLSKLEAFVEIKPTPQAAAEAANGVMKALVQQSQKRGLVIAGPPNDRNMMQINTGHGGRIWFEDIEWRQCFVCGGIGFQKCKCVSPVEVWRDRTDRWSLIDHAAAEAQRARFEHGEDGRPRPHRPSTARVNVYWAGSVIEEVDAGECLELDGSRTQMKSSKVCAWRQQIACPSGRKVFAAETFAKHRLGSGRFIYAGPTILECHGEAEEGLAEDCIAEVKDADALFVWIDRPETVGTLVEIGAAHASGKPIFIAFSDRELPSRFYFARQLASVAITAPTAVLAFHYFRKWWEQRP
jgi:hypothetical protein